MFKMTMQIAMVSSLGTAYSVSLLQGAATLKNWETLL